MTSRRSAETPAIGPIQINRSREIGYCPVFHEGSGGVARLLGRRGSRICRDLAEDGQRRRTSCQREGGRNGRDVSRSLLDWAHRNRRIPRRTGCALLGHQPRQTEIGRIHCALSSPACPGAGQCPACPDFEPIGRLCRRIHHHTGLRRRGKTSPGRPRRFPSPPASFNGTRPSPGALRSRNPLVFLGPGWACPELLTLPGARAPSGSPPAPPPQSPGRSRRVGRSLGSSRPGLSLVERRLRPKVSPTPGRLEE